MTKSDARTVRATETSLRIIEAIQEGNGQRITELAEHLDLSKSTVHSHLATLEKHGYIINEGSIYQVGLRFLNLGQYAKERKEAWIIAEKWVEELSEATTEEVDFAVEEHGRVVPLYDGIGRSNKLSRDRTGRYFHMHNTSVGKAILAELPAADVVAIIDKWGLPATTENTITSRDRLEMELDATRERGYAMNNEESIDGLRAIACAVMTPAGEVCGAMSVTGPSYRLTSEAIENEVSPILKQVVRGFEEELSQSRS
jgi:DNA-binding IclR family transcriptional regulator